MEIIPTKCDRCGKMVTDFYPKAEWWEKYLLPEESQICYDCIKNRSDFKEEFQKNTGVSTKELERIKKRG